MIIYIAWVLYSILEGAREAVFYAFRDHLKSFIYNEHILYTIQRAIVLGICAYMEPWILLSGPFAFPFFHDGAYYTMRNLIDSKVYREGWFAQSTTSTAWLTKFFTPTVRMVCFVISLILAGILISGCNKTISGVIVDKAMHTPHFTLEVGEYHYKIIETSVVSWDTLEVGDYIEFKCKRGYKNKASCLTYD